MFISALLILIFVSDIVRSAHFSGDTETCEQAAPTTTGGDQQEKAREANFLAAAAALVLVFISDFFGLTHLPGDAKTCEKSAPAATPGGEKEKTCEPMFLASAFKFV